MGGGEGDSVVFLVRSQFNLTVNSRNRPPLVHGKVVAYERRSKFNIVGNVYDFSMTRAVRAIKIACDRQS